MKCFHPVAAMLYSDDYCACRKCEQTWELKKVKPDLWVWEPKPPITEKKFAPKYNGPKKKTKNVPVSNFRKAKTHE